MHACYELLTQGSSKNCTHVLIRPMHGLASSYWQCLCIPTGDTHQTCTANPNAGVLTLAFPYSSCTGSRVWLRSCLCRMLVRTQ